MQGALIAGLLVVSATACHHGSEAEMDEAMAFLYESMPLPDSVDYPRQFWLDNCVKPALLARSEMPWGEKVPEREWRHFVLPLRVNNENLDSARTVFYQELKDRVRNLSMRDAVLEVNHWCHEHVSYAPSDGRTSSPLQTMLNATGRCGEESTFTVTALRAVGIPARQVYTPRWAHTDDNHAWVEAWVDGKWYFLGACEPEPILNLGWFNAPASRGMLMHTKVFGHYDGPEEVVGVTPCYTEINVTSNYAPVDTIVVRSLSADSVPVSDAKVEYKLYNYAEFYTLVSKQTDADGLSSLSCGKGDLVVWVSKDGKFGFEKASVGEQDTVTVVLDKDDTFTGSVDIDICPPAESRDIPKLTEQQQRDKRASLAREDSLRNAYMAETFFQGKDELLVKARRNWHVLQDFLQGSEGKTAAGSALPGTLREKDLRDVSMEVLADHATNCAPGEGDIWRSYVLCPRISNEMLTPYRATLAKVFHGMDAHRIADWVRDSITCDDARNPQHLCMSPLGVYRHRVTDSHSRDIFYVAAVRSAGLPARIDEVTGKVQYYDAEAGWVDVLFGEAPAAAPQGTLYLIYSDYAISEHPGYYSHFTFSRLSHGRLQLQEFPEDATWESTFAQGARMDAGQYLMVSGTRLADGGVLAHLEFLGIPGGGSATSQLHLRDSKDELRVIGNFNCENYFTNVKGMHKTLLQSTGRGYYVVGLIRSNHEPSTHVLHDLEECNIYLSQWPHCFLMLFPSQEEYDHFRRDEFDGLPDNFIFGVADPETVEAMHIQELTHGSDELPILMMADTFNRVIWFSQGYTIGIGEQVMKVIRKLLKTDEP